MCYNVSGDSMKKYTINEKEYQLIKDYREGFDLSEVTDKLTEYFEEYDLNKVVRAIASFVSDDLSNWYIRRNRNRFWASVLDDSKKSVYVTTYEHLLHPLNYDKFLHSQKE